MDPLHCARADRLALAGSAAFADGADATPGVVERPLLEAVVAAGSPGALVLVDRDGSRRQEARGLAVVQGRVPLLIGDRFRAASITKTFVAVIVLQLSPRSGSG